LIEFYKGFGKNKDVEDVWRRLKMVKNNRNRNIERSIELFSLQGELRSIHDPLHARILELLKAGNATFKELHQSLGRAKSTVSLKINDLITLGLIEETISATDKRVKYYTLKAKQVGRNTKGTPALFEQSIAKLDKYVDNPFEFTNAMFRSVWYLLDSFGVDSQHMLAILGEEVGKQVAKTLPHKNQDALVKAIIELYKKHKLGYIKIVKEEPLTLHLFDCYQCGNLKEYERKLCVFDKSLLQTIFTEALGKTCTLHELACAKAGKTYCEYEIKS